MPDNRSNYKYVFQTEYDPKGVQKASRGISQFSGLMVGLNKKFGRMDFLKGFSGVSGLRRELDQTEQGMAALRAQFAKGLIDKASYKADIAALKLARSELRGLTTQQYNQRVEANRLFQQQQKLAEANSKELQKLALPAEAFNNAMKDGMVQAGTLLQELQSRGWSANIEQATMWAEKYNQVNTAGIALLEQEAIAARKLREAATFGAAFKSGMRNLGRAVVQPFKDAYGWATRIPTRMVEGLKGGIANLFSGRGLIARAAGGMLQRVFSKKTLWRTAMLGPLGFLSGVMTKPKTGNDREGFTSGEDSGGQLGKLGKALGSFGGMIKYAVGSLGPMALLMKALAPVFQTLNSALRPLMAPLQKLLGDAVIQFVPFIKQMATILVDLTNELMPVVKQLVDSLGPVLVELAKALLPPLVKVLKLTAWWIEKVTVPIIKKMIPTFTRLAEKVGEFVEGIVRAIGWMGKKLLDTPVIGWALKKLGYNEAMFTGMQEYGAQPTVKGALATLAPEERAQVEASGVLASTNIMADSKADVAETQRPLSELVAVPETMPGRSWREERAMREAMQRDAMLLRKQDPEEMSEPVVKALKSMTDRLITFLPGRIGEQTKTVSLADFGAVTF